MANCTCSNYCSKYPKSMNHMHGENVYDKNAYCRNCRRYFLKTLLIKNSIGGKVLCPCCRGKARQRPTTSARNRTIRRRNGEIYNAG